MHIAVRAAMRLAHRILVGYALALLLVTLTPITEWLGLPLYLAPATSDQPVDAIVVLEAWATQQGELNESGLNRAFKAAEWYHAGASKVMVLTGLRPTESRPGSALAPMTRVLTRLGVPREAILIDDESPNTRSSALYVAALARTRKWSSVALVTDLAHMKRASLALRRAGIHRVVFAPTVWWDLGAGRPSLRLQRVGIIAHEYGGLLYYWWQGWI